MIKLCSAKAQANERYLSTLMNLEEMKLAVCEKLPELVRVSAYTNDRGQRYGTTIWTKGVNAGNDISWPTEGLQVCHEAEKFMSPVELSQLDEILTDIVSNKARSPYAMDYFAWRATWEQKLEALCRVWWPERFDV